MRDWRRHTTFEYIGLEIILLLLAAAIVQTVLYRAETLDLTLVRNAFGGALQSQKTNSPATSPETISIFHVGDMMFDRGVRAAMEQGALPLSTIPDAEADFFIGNLEGPVTTHTTCQEKAYSFRFDPTLPSMLRAAGVDAVTIANNHSYDCYRQGFEDTKKYLAEAGMLSFGAFRSADSVTITRIHGMRVALIGVDTTISALPVHEYESLVRSLASTTDLQIVSIHWGNEYELVESEAQRILAHAFVDAGADAVFGHHPHVVQPIELYNGTPIFYSLGNYIFDQTEPDTKRGIGVTVAFSRAGAVSIVINPFTINRAVPTFQTGEIRKVSCAQLITRGFTSSADPCRFDL